MKTNGFNTRKMERLNDDKRCLLIRLRLIDKMMKDLVRTKSRCKRNLAKLESAIETLSPKLKCEEDRTVRLIHEPNPSTKEIGELF